MTSSFDTQADPRSRPVRFSVCPTSDHLSSVRSGEPLGSEQGAKQRFLVVDQGFQRTIDERRQIDENGV